MVFNALAEFRQTAIQEFVAKREDIAVDFVNDNYRISIPDEDSPAGEWVSTLKFQDDALTFASCDCPDGDCCLHLMIAYFAAFDACKWVPMHKLFRSSFLYTLCWQFFSEGIHLEAIGDRQYAIESAYAKLHISASPEAFSSWLSTLHQTPEPTTYSEKTFPNSSLYRAAKCFYSLLRNGACLKFQNNAEGLPAIFSIEHEGLCLHGEILDPDTLKKVFAKMDFSRTSLLNSDQQYTTSQIRVDSKTGRIAFTLTPQPDQSQEIDQHIGSIGYISSLEKVVPSAEEYSIPIHIVPILPEQLKQQLCSCLNYSDNKPLRYHIQLLADSSLSFSAYLEEPGDLDNSEFIYPSFCHSPQKGLFSIEGALSDELHFIVKADQVEEFLNDKGALIQEPGFQVFSDRAPDGHMTYNITNQGVLLFHYHTGETNSVDAHYGPWTYYPGQGFFLQTKSDSEIQDALIIEPEKISDFIIQHEAKLQNIPNFFAPPPPLTDILFEVYKEPKGQGLFLKPIFQGLEDERCRLFNMFLYRENLGFNLLPAHLQSASTIPQQVPGEQVLDFIQQHFSSNNKLIFTDPSLCPAEAFELIIRSISRSHPSSPLHLELDLKTNIGSVPLGTVLQALKGKKSFIFSPAGLLDFQHCLFQFLKQFLAAQKCLIPNNSVIATVTDIFKLDALAPLSMIENVQASEEDLAFFNQLKAACLPPIPQSLFSTDHKLRPYQNSGLLWLWFLYNHRLSGLLCDEMGLGKTHQATALLDIVFQSASANKEKPKLLVICPTSVLPHWEHTLATHISNASIFAFHGPNKPETLPPVDIIITSYGTLRQNYAKFYKISFTVTVCDEIHMAKNKNSQIHKILCRLDSQMKLGLTGTPVENNLIEFKSLLDIILPNYLPSDALFKKLFTKKPAPAAVELDESMIPSQDLLLKLTRPFILRRTKKLVLPELPDKVESIIPCSLSPEQQKLYLSTLRKEKTQIQKLDQDNEQGNVNYLHVFALLNHLKQICNHPAIFYKTPDEYRKYASGKWDTFVRLLNESLAAGYKVVVFSQYIQMIRIITLYLDEIGVKYASIQGKSLNRKEEIEYFSQDPECRVFVGSLLAAGTGINLTAGNVVIMYDRWWNPAKENQALDRVHRIGQKNTVFIYKLVTEDTLEERIHYIIEKKILLLDKVVSSQDTNILHMLNKEDLRTILSYKDELGGSEEETSEEASAEEDTAN